MRHETRAWVLPRALALALVVVPVTAAAQGPTSPPHPSMPWALGPATPQGQLLRYIYMPPQPVTLEYTAPAPPASETPAEEPTPMPAGGAARTDEAAPPASETPGPQVVRQQVTVPGYYVRETTVGFLYPERWVIEQGGVNVYRWRQLPPQFVPK